MSAKELLYAAAKGIGAFRLANAVTGQDLRILCYHGLSFTDEHLFRPKLFMTLALFEQRMRYLKRAGYQTLSLGEGMNRLRQGTLTDRDVVITFDDGFYATHALAAPLMREQGFTATIYVTSYYVEHNNPIFRLALQYAFWKAAECDFDTNGLMPGLAGRRTTIGAVGNTLLWNLILHGETQLDENGRRTLASEVARRVGLDFEELLDSRRLTLMTATEISELARQGFDIQLHTHRHSFPEERELATREIVDNRRILEPLVQKPLTHLCYPSGEWTPAVWPSLTDNNVETATTCKSGRNTPQTSPFALFRFLDFQTTPQIVFEAEVNGFASLLRNALGQ